MRSVNFSYRLFALTMAVLMFSTSVGFSIDTHYCQNDLVSSSFLGKASSCYELAGMKNPNKTCSLDQKTGNHQHEGTLIDQKECCHNTTVHFRSEGDQNITTGQIIAGQQLQQFMAAYVTAFFASDSGDVYDNTSFIHYQSPIISRDIHVLFESYLL